MVWLPLTIILFAFLYTLYSLFWPEYSRNKLIREGVQANGIILDADPTGSVYNSQPEIRFRLRVSPADGREYEAETDMIINPIYAPQFQPGKTVKVRYDQQDRARVTIEETENGQR